MLLLLLLLLPAAAGDVTATPVRASRPTFHTRPACLCCRTHEDGCTVSPGRTARPRSRDTVGCGRAKASETSAQMKRKPLLTWRAPCFALSDRSPPAACKQIPPHASPT